MSQDKAQLIALLQKLLADDGQGDLTAVKDSITNIQDRLATVAGRVQQTERDHAAVNAVVADLSKRIDERPVRHVQVNDRPVIELTGRVHPLMPLIIQRVRLGLRPALVGPAGAGKSYLCEQVAKALGLEYSYVNLTQGASETWLFGRQTPAGFFEGPFATRYRLGGVFLADELDAADANLLLSINTALEAKSMFNPMNGETIPKHKDFVFMAAMNTNGKGATGKFTGRTRLDASTLDRLRLMSVDYNTDLERDLCPDDGLFNYFNAIRAKLLEGKLEEFVSTRAFIAGYSELSVGISFEAIMSSMVLNWSDAAKKIAKDLEWIFQAAQDDETSDDGDETGDETKVDAAGTPVKRGRGRPRKYPRPDDAAPKTFVGVMTKGGQ